MGNRKIKHTGNGEDTVFSAALLKDDLCRGLWIMKDAKMAANFVCQKAITPNLEKKKGGGGGGKEVYQGNKMMCYMQA